MASVKDQIEVLARFVGVILASIPSTTLVPLPLTAALTRRFKREELLKRLHFMVPWAAFCRRFLLSIDLEVHGREHLPKPSRGHMYVSNHQSWADILVLMEALDTVAFLSKTLVKLIPNIGRCAYAGGSVYVARNSAESRRRALREMLRMCRESTAVVVFPEGTRSADGELQKIHAASLRAAYAHALRVVPVAIDGSWLVLPKTMDHLTPGRVVVEIGPPLDPADFANAETWIEAVWGKVTELHAAARARRSPCLTDC
jgi:1-acyl-sn-glycerol-3-phosphate acyltransferase